MSSNTKPKVSIYDTTLRDGTQGVGISFSVLDKIRISQKLDKFGIDYIEGGWPGSNPKDIEYFKKASEMKWLHAKIVAFGSTRRANTLAEDDKQVQLLLEANTPAVTIFGKSWDLHVTEVLRTTLEENQAMIRDTCRILKDNGREVIYDAEHFFDGYKHNPSYALSTLQAAKEGGADILILCDTNGGTLPKELGEICSTVKSELDMAFGIHTHDDSGVGVANALKAVESGASQIQGTINGYGERVGNCNLTSVIPNLILKLKLPQNINVKELTSLSRYVDEVANMLHFSRSPFVGTSAFSHKGGMHVNAVEKLAKTYEHIEPKSVGNKQHILVSELSGQSNVIMKAKDMGIDLKKNDPSIKSLLQKMKTLESKGYEFEAAEASFKLLLVSELGNFKPFFNLLEYHCSHRRRIADSKSFETCEATVKITIDGEKVYTVAEGDGPVNALDKALRKALEPKYPQLKDISLADYKVRIIDSHQATAARTRVLIVSKNGKSRWGTVGVSNNIIQASWLALVDSINYYLLTNH